MKKNFSRRQFVTTGLMGLSAMALSNSSAASVLSLSNIRVGLIGVGQRGLGLANVMKSIPGLELAACCDIMPANLAAGMKIAAPKSKSYTDYRKLLQDKSIDAVIIATPLFLHYQMAMDALSAGKHIYLEKTMTYNIEEALALTRKVKRYPKLIFQVGHQYRYYDLYPKIKALIENDLIGKVTHYECQYNRNNDWRRKVTDPKLEKQINWRMYKEFSGGVLAELSAHQIDVVNWLEDSRPEKVVAIGDVNYWKDGRTTADNVRAIYEYPNGVKASMTSILSNEFNGYMTRILGDKGTIEIGRDTATLYLERKQKETAIVDGVTGATKDALLKGQGVTIYTDREKIEPTQFALAAFEESIRSKTKALSNELTGRDAAIAVHMGNTAVDTETVQHWKPEYSAV